ncbi:MAG: NADH-quinone oxidoreductase subunit A [Anaerolineales bacterium]
MLADYLPIAILIFMATTLAFLVVGIGHLFGPRRQTLRKSEPYESGMRPIGPGRRQVEVHFYLVAVLFILFDIEIVFLLPWAITLRKLGLYGLIEMAIFIAILLVGYVYAWRKGALEWH